MRYLLALAIALSLPVTLAMAVEQAQQSQQPEQARTLKMATSLRPSVATYHVALLGGNNQKFASAEGSYTDEARMTCAGWDVKQRLYVRFMPPAPAPGVRVLPVHLRSGANIFESRDGLYYRFEDKTSMAGQMLSEHKGEARLTAVGQGGTATYTLPKPSTMELPAGTIFPTHFAYRLVSAAGDGQNALRMNVFDGSMGQDSGVLRVVANISSRVQAAQFKLPQVAESAASTNDFAMELAWPVRINYFAGNSTDSRPIMQLNQILLPNGRPEKMVMPVGEHKLELTLVKLEYLPTPSCP